MFIVFFLNIFFCKQSYLIIFNSMLLKVLDNFKVIRSILPKREQIADLLFNSFSKSELDGYELHSACFQWSHLEAYLVYILMILLIKAFCRNIFAKHSTIFNSFFKSNFCIHFLWESTYYEIFNSFGSSCVHQFWPKSALMKNGSPPAENEI